LASSHEDMFERYLAISSAIARQVDFQSVLGEVAKEIHKIFDHDHMDISIVPIDHRDRTIVFEVGLKTEWSENSERQHSINMSPIREILLGKKEHILCSDAWKDEQFHFDGAFDSPIFSANLRSRMHVPIQVHGVVHGSLNISSHQIGKYTIEDIVTVRQIADLIAPYVYALIRAEQAKKLTLADGAARGREESFRLGTLRLTEGMEDERKRIGMDLHDQTLADLTRMSRYISHISGKSAPTNADFNKLGTDISNCMGELRRIIEDTKPGVLELFGFTQAVEAQLERSVTGVVPQIQTRVEDATESFLDGSPDSVRTTLFRIVQEAINNAIKHGKAKTISVFITRDKDGVCISVVDDGSGPRPQIEQSSGGLDNMRVRAALISAKLLMSGYGVGRGTRVSIIVGRHQLGLPPPDTLALYSDYFTGVT